MSSTSAQPHFIFTADAIDKAKELEREFPRYNGLVLRIYVEGKGCDGFTYGITFDSPSSNDVTFEVDGLTCIIDPQSLVFANGSTISWVDDHRGTGFLLTNPNESKYRGKFYKRKAWQGYLEKLRVSE